MYSSIWCAMSKESVWCRNMWSRWNLTPLSNHQRGPAPFPPPGGSWPSSPYIPSLAIGDSVYWEALNKDGSGVGIHSQPSTNPMLLDNVCNITLISLRKLYLKCLSNDWLPSTDCCYILGWLTTTRNKRDSPMCVHHIFLGCSEQ